MDEISLKNEIHNGLSHSQIASRYNVSKATVRYYLDKYSLKTKIKRIHPNLIVDYFKIIDSEEKAYWLGFLYADGCVKKNDNRNGKSENRYALVLELATKDEERIDVFCKAINADITKKSYTTRMGKYHAVSIRIYGDFVNHLVNQGCIPNKTFRIKHPIFNNKNLDLSFLLGFYDGDGSVGGTITCGNVSFLNSIKERYYINSDIKYHGCPLLVIPKDIRKQMFAAYKNSMSRKRKMNNYKSVFERTGIRYIPKTKISWPSIEEMQKMVWEKPTYKLAKQLGISDKAIEKYCLKNKISKPSRGFWQKMADVAEVDSA